MSYLVLRFADDSFVHVSHDHGDDEPNPIASTEACAHVQDGHSERRKGGVDQQSRSSPVPTSQPSTEDERPALFLDADCGFCRWCAAKVLAWDREESIVPLAIGSPEADALLEGIDPGRRLASWHFRDRDGAVFSAGAAFPPLLRLLPGASPLARVASRFPGGVERAYRLVADHRRALGWLVTGGAAERADRRLAARIARVRADLHVMVAEARAVRENRL